MNNELPAEQLAQWCDEASQEYGNKPLVQAATMLRQQQAEIEALKYEKSSGVYDLEKTLTDEEIMDAYVEHCKTEASGKGNLIDFARAILRKAQEK